MQVDPLIVPAVKALDAYLRKWNYRATPPDCGAFNCRKITNGDDWSLHAYGIAMDINWLDNPYGPTLVTDMPWGMVADILALRTRSGWRVWGWGGQYTGNKDSQHFEVVCSPANLSTGIVAPEPDPPPLTPEELEELELMTAKQDILDAITAMRMEVKSDTNQLDARLDRLGAGLTVQHERLETNLRARIDERSVKTVDDVLAGLRPEVKVDP
jgi:hypothetical protein